MCGICGYAGFDDEALLDKMINMLSHRGPDGKGRMVDKRNKVYLGNTRLSIIDLKTGNQPIYNETKTAAIIFNGEIYNFRELRGELIKEGHRFRTNSDTEVIIHLYEKHGFDMPRFLNGIFAFAIYDLRKRVVFCSRDYFGIKPFFYHFSQGKLIFGSEIKAILTCGLIKRSVNREALHYSLNLRYAPGELTLFKGINKLLPGHCLIYDIDAAKISRIKYWKKNYRVDKRIDKNTAIEGIRHYLKQAVGRQLVSDVPVGLYLSGGMDSSSIAAYASAEIPHVSSYSMGFDEPTDEITDARKVADYFNTDFHETFLKKDPLSSMEEVVWHLEEPKVNMLQGYFLSKFASRFVKVVLSGLGGDELFAGYTNNQYLYPMEGVHDLFRKSNPFSFMSDFAFRIENNLGKLELDEYRRGLQMLFAYGDKAKFYLILRNAWDHDDQFYSNIYSKEIKDEMMVYQTRNLFEKYFRGRDESIVEQSLKAEFNLKMVDDFLVNEDRTSMAHGLESRVPFLDRDLVEFAFSIPHKLKIKRNHTKYIFKEAMKGVLPDFVIEKKKWGFAINPYFQFKKDLKKIALEVLTKKKIEKQGIFNFGYINKIINYPPSKRLRWHYYYLWQVIAFQHWHELFIEDKYGKFN